MPKVEAEAHRRRVKERAARKRGRAFHKDATYVEDIFNRVPEPVKQAVDSAYRAMGLDQKLHQEGFIMRGDVVRDTIERILSLESEPYQEFVRESIVETSELLNHLLDTQGYDSGKRKYYPLKKSDEAETQWSEQQRDRQRKTHILSIDEKLANKLKKFLEDRPEIDPDTFVERAIKRMMNHIEEQERQDEKDAQHPGYKGRM